MSRKLLSCKDAEVIIDYTYSSGGTTVDVYFDLLQTHASNTIYDFIAVAEITHLSGTSNRVKIYNSITDSSLKQARHIRVDGTRKVGEDYSSINGISSINYFDPYFLTSMSGTFKGAKNLTSVNSLCWRFRNNIDMSSAFADCGITSLDFSHIDLSKITNITNMFKNCNSLSYIKLTHSDASKITSIVNQLPTHTSGTYTIDISGNTSTVLSSLSNLSRTGWTIKRS